MVASGGYSLTIAVKFQSRCIARPCRTARGQPFEGGVNPALRHQSSVGGPADDDDGERERAQHGDDGGHGVLLSKDVIQISGGRLDLLVTEKPLQGRIVEDRHLER